LDLLNTQYTVSIQEIFASAGGKFQALTKLSLLQKTDANRHPFRFLLFVFFLLTQQGFFRLLRLLAALISLENTLANAI